jgi:hypothetical protein
MLYISAIIDLFMLTFSMKGRMNMTIRKIKPDGNCFFSRVNWSNIWLKRWTYCFTNTYYWFHIGKARKFWKLYWSRTFSVMRGFYSSNPSTRYISWWNNGSRFTSFITSIDRYPSIWTVSSFVQFSISRFK